MKVGDWVVDDTGDVGQISDIEDSRYEGVMVYCKWLKWGGDDDPTWVAPEQITVITKEVADVIFKSNTKE